MQGNRFASCENIVSQFQTSSGKLQCYDHYSSLPRPRAVDGSFPEFPIDTDTPVWVGLQMPLFSGEAIYKLLKNS